MTTETTQKLAQTDISLQRLSYMKALSLAEQIMSETPVMPTEFDVRVPKWAPGEPELVFNFHRNADGVRAFAGWRRMDVVSTDQANGSILVEARGELPVEGVRVSAWTLLPSASAVAA